MKIRIKNTPLTEMKTGGLFESFPYAGSNTINPFGNISSNTTSDEDNIASSVRAVDREDANMEAEKGEVLLKYDLGGLFNIKGKRHSEGGTPLVANPGDFIFSRDKDLAISKKEKEIFEFKEGGSYKKLDNTPAKILNREVNSKHYNQLISILNDPKSDDIAKKTAELMLEKYTNKIGQIAYLQESKKGFPNGLPSFSSGTAPVQSDEFNDVEAKEKMYAKMGGQYNFRKGGTRRNDSLPPSFVPPYQQAIPGDITELQDWGESLVPYGYTGDTKNVNQIQQWMNNNAPDSAPYIYSNGIFGLNNKGYDANRNPIDPQYIRNQFNDGKWLEDAWGFQNKPFDNYDEYNNFTQNNPKVGALKGAGDYYFDDQVNDRGKPMFTIPSYRGQMNSLPLANNPSSTLPTSLLDFNGNAPTLDQNNNVSNKLQSRRGRVANADTSLPWNAQEKLTTALPFLQAFMRKDQYPMLQQIHTPDIRLDRISNQQELSDIQQQSALTQRELFNNMDGQAAYINSNQLRAQTINNMGRSNAQNNNVNTQISNQEDTTNYQTMVNDRNFNIQAIGKNYDETNLVLGRRQKEMADAFGQSINNGVQIQDKLDSLKQLMVQSQMKSLDKNGQPRYILDPNTRTPVLNPNWNGDFINNPFIGRNKSQANSLLDELKRKFPGAADKDLLRTYAYFMKPNSKGQSAFDEMSGG